MSDVKNPPMLVDTLRGSGGNSDLVLRFGTADPAVADKAMRALLDGGVFDEDAGSAMWAMSGADISAGAVRGTTLRALESASCWPPRARRWMPSPRTWAGPSWCAGRSRTSGR